MGQPEWKCVAQLGDVHPVKHGGMWVMVDQTGVYQPELEILEVDKMPRSDKHGGRGLSAYEWSIYRVTMDPVTVMADIVSDNPHHPELPAWWADSLDSVRNSIDTTADQMLLWLCSDDPIERANGYSNLISYFGAGEWDSSPLRYTWNDRLKVYSRYRRKVYRVVA